MKNKNPLYIIYMCVVIGIFFGVLWLIFADRLLFAFNNTKVINEFFLNRMKVMTIVKNVVIDLCIGLIIIPLVEVIVVYKFCDNRIVDNKKFFVFSIFLLCLLMVIPNIKRLVVQPYVEQHMVINKDIVHLHKGGNNYDLYLDNNSKISVSNFYYENVNVNDEVYVVFLDDEVVGVFPLCDYTLDTNFSSKNIK